MPTIAEIQAQQQALKVMEAENSFPHLQAILPALTDDAVAALVALCLDRGPLIADPEVRQAFFNIGSTLSNSVGNLTRMRDAAALLVPGED